MEPDHELLGYLPAWVRASFVGRSWSGHSPFDLALTQQCLSDLDGAMTSRGKLIVKHDDRFIVIAPYNGTNQGIGQFLMIELRLRRDDNGTSVLMREALPQFYMGLSGGLLSLSFVATIVITSMFAFGQRSDGALAGYGLGLFVAAIFACVTVLLLKDASTERLPSAREDVVRVLGLQQLSEVDATFFYYRERWV